MKNTINSPLPVRPLHGTGVQSVPLDQALGNTPGIFPTHQGPQFAIPSPEKVVVELPVNVKTGR